MTNLIMTVRDRFTLTRQALESLRSHTDCNDYTLTIVDDGSTDFRVVRLLNDEALANPSRVSVLHVHNGDHRLSHLKNLGAYWSEQHFGRTSGDHICFLDNDVCFFEGWLPKMIRGLRHVSLIGGCQHPYHHTNETSDDVLVTDMVAGYSLLMTWNRWYHFGPFSIDTAPGVCKGEDTQLSHRLSEVGLKVGYIHPAVLVHTGITNSEGKPATGSEFCQKIPGVIYE